MKIAGHTLGTPDHTVPEALKLFRRAGLDAAGFAPPTRFFSSLFWGAWLALRRAGSADGG